MQSGMFKSRIDSQTPFPYRGQVFINRKKIQIMNCSSAVELHNSAIVSKWRVCQLQTMLLIAFSALLIFFNVSSLPTSSFMLKKKISLVLPVLKVISRGEQAIGGNRFSQRKLLFSPGFDRNNCLTSAALHFILSLMFSQ